MSRHELQTRAEPGANELRIGVTIATLSAALLAVGNCWLWSTLADQQPERPWHEVMRPFGFRSVLLTQALAALPLCAIAAQHFPNRGRRPLGLLAWGLVSLASLQVSGLQMSSIRSAVMPADSTLWFTVERFAWVLLWQVPVFWILVPAGASVCFQGGVRWAAALLALVPALAIPALYVGDLYDFQWQRSQRLVTQERLWDAWLLTGRLQELRRATAATSATDLHRQLTSRLAVVSSRCDQLLPNEDGPALLSRARDLAALARDEEAETICHQLAAIRPSQPAEAGTWRSSQLLLAELAARRADWLRAADYCAAALGAWQRTDPDSVDLPAFHTALAAQADYLRRGGQFQTAAEVLLDARAACRTSGDYIDQMLAEHHQAGGRPWQAASLYQSVLSHQAQAQQPDPELVHQATAALRTLGERTPWCLWSRLGGNGE